MLRPYRYPALVTAVIAGSALAVHGLRLLLEAL